jgi:hypothetical protein
VDVEEETNCLVRKPTIESYSRQYDDTIRLVVRKLSGNVEWMLKKRPNYNGQTICLK